MSDAREADAGNAHHSQPSMMRQWLSRFADPIVLVALIAAVASASFAYQTNRISERQVELLNRQVAIEESLALPVFTVRMDVGDAPGSATDSHWVTIHNSGGLASDLSIDVLPYLSYWWTEDDETGQPVATQGEELPVMGYFHEYSHVLPAHMEPGTTTVLGFDGNATALRNVSGALGSQLAARDGVSGLDHGLEIMVSLSYIDYTGVERADYYVAHVNSNGEIFPPQQFIRVNATVGEEIWQDYYEKFDSQFMLVLDPDASQPEDAVIQQLSARIYDQRHTDLENTATPVAAHTRSRIMREATVASS